MSNSECACERMVNSIVLVKWIQLIWNTCILRTIELQTIIICTALRSVPAIHIDD